MPPNDPADKIKILEEKIKGLDQKDVDGNLMIKIYRRETSVPGGIFSPQVYCTLTGGAITHVANPELWLPALAGGGSFSLAVHAPGSSSVALVDGINFTLTGREEYKFPNLDALDDISWKGPRAVIFPTKVATKSSPSTVIASPPGAAGTIPAPQTPLPGSASSGVTHQDQELRRLIEEQRAYSAALQRQLEEERRLREEERHKREMEALRIRQEAELERQKLATENLRKEIEAIKATPPPAQKAPSLLEMLKEALPVAAPLITTWMNASAERERRAEERQAEILKSIQSRPAIDPMIKEILDQQSANQLPMATFMQQSAASTGALLNQMTEMAKTMLEMSAGPEESPVIKATREVGNVIQGLVTASNTAPRPPRRLPRQEVGEAPPPTPSRPQAQPAMNGLDEKIPVPPNGVLAKLKAMLIAHEDPEKVAAETIKAFPSPEFQKALEGVGGDPEALFGQLLGVAWIQANLEYANAFGTAFTKQAQQAGLGGEDEGAEEEAA